jgi:hypothetical protein
MTGMRIKEAEAICRIAPVIALAVGVVVFVIGFQKFRDLR